MEFEKEVIDRLARIEQDIKPITGLVAAMNANNTAIEVLKGDVRDHDRRISNIEGWGTWLVMAVGVLIVGGVWQVITK